MCELNKQYSSRIKKLRILMNKSKIDALYIPHEDEHLTEYIPRNKERLKWALGFSGSAGSSILLKMKFTYLWMEGICCRQKMKRKN